MISGVLCSYSSYVTDRIDNNQLMSTNYVGVDNLLPNKAGRKNSDYVPSDGQSTRFQPGDILIGNIRPYFKKIWLADREGGCSADVLCIRPNKGIDPRFLYAYLSTDSFFDYDMAGSKGSKMPRGDKNHIMNYPITIPDCQKDIGLLFSNIEKRIGNNNKISSELESLAKTIYDYWFLQFEFPNEEGKPYKSSGGGMVYNEELKREIPEGWIVKSVKDCIKHINTGLNPRDNFVLNDATDVRYITVKNLTTDGQLDFTGCDYISFETKDLVNKRSQIQGGDILFASIAPLGRCYLIMETPKDWEINESVFSIRPNLDVLSGEYLYMFFMSDWFIKKAENSSTGSVFSGIRVSVLEDTKILIPSSEIMEQFTDKVSSIMKLKYKKEQENHQLSSLRDWLLPMLMNGQATFKETE